MSGTSVFIIRFLTFVVGISLLTGCRPVDVVALHRDASLAARDGRFREAAELAERAVGNGSTDADLLVLYGFCLFQSDRRMEAVDVLEQAVGAAVPGTAQEFHANYFHGWALSELPGKAGDAVAPLERARKLAPKLGLDAYIPDILVLLGECCLEQNLPQGVGYLQALRRYSRFRDSPEVYNALGVLWLNQGDPQSALENFLEAKNRAENNAVVLQNLAVLYDIYLRDPEMALRYYRRSLVARNEARDTSRSPELLGRMRQLARERLGPGANGH